MDIFEALFTRRSIRKYTQEDVSDEDLNIMLKAAMLAPRMMHPCKSFIRTRGQNRSKPVRRAFREAYCPRLIRSMPPM